MGSSAGSSASCPSADTIADNVIYKIHETGIHNTMDAQIKEMISECLYNENCRNEIGEIGKEHAIQTLIILCPYRTLDTCNNGYCEVDGHTCEASYSGIKKLKNK